MTHAFLAPSSADVIAHCAGAPMLSAGFPDSEKHVQASMEGTASHWVVSTVLESWKYNVHVDPHTLVGVQAPNDVVITVEMVEGAEVMIDAVLDVASQLDDRTELHVEETMDIPSISEHMFGTPDCWLYLNGVIHLWDYKYGHKHVPGDSWQNVAYIAGVLDKLRINGQSEIHTKVRMGVVQPRSFHSDGPVKIHECLAVDLRARFNILVKQCALAMTHSPPTKAGTHCKYCTARHSCDAARVAAYAALDYAGTSVPDVLTNDGISFELGMLERAQETIDHRLSAVKEMAIVKIQSGEVIKGFTVEGSLGNRYFKGDEETLRNAALSLGVELFDKPRMLSPSKVEKQIKELQKESELEIDSTVITQYIKRDSTGDRLKKTSDSFVHKIFQGKN